MVGSTLNIPKTRPRIVRNCSSSLVPTNTHDVQLLRLLSLPVSHQMVAYVAAFTNALVGDNLRVRSPTDSNESIEEEYYPRKQRSQRSSNLPKLEAFIHHVCKRSALSTPTLMTSLIYLSRLRSRMPNKAAGKRSLLSFASRESHRFVDPALPGTAHRIFLAALIVAAKFVNDSTLKNKVWTDTAALFPLDEVNLMEKQLLFLLDFDLAFNEEEAIWHFQPIFELMGDVVKTNEGYNRLFDRSSVQSDNRPLSSVMLTAQGSGTFNGAGGRGEVPASIKKSEKRPAATFVKSQRPSEERVRVRESAVRRVTQGSQERMARVASYSGVVDSSTSAIVAPPRVSSRVIPDNVSTSSSTLSLNLPNAKRTSNGSLLSAVLSRGPSTDSVASTVSTSSTAGTTSSSDLYNLSSSARSSTSIGSMTSAEDESALRVRIEAKECSDIEMESGDSASIPFLPPPTVDMTGIGAGGAIGAAKMKKAKEAMTESQIKKRSFSWARRRAGSASNPTQDFSHPAQPTAAFRPSEIQHVRPRVLAKSFRAHVAAPSQSSEILRPRPTVTFGSSSTTAINHHSQTSRAHHSTGSQHQFQPQPQTQSRQQHYSALRHHQARPSTTSVNHASRHSSTATIVPSGTKSSARRSSFIRNASASSNGASSMGLSVSLSIGASIRNFLTGGTGSNGSGSDHV